MATIKDVARVAGVSVASVSRVLNNGPKVSKDTIDKVSRVMQELNYTPNANARALVTQKSTTLGVVIPDLVDPFSPRWLTVLNKSPDKKTCNCY